MGSSVEFLGRVDCVAQMDELACFYVRQHDKSEFLKSKSLFGNHIQEGYTMWFCATQCSHSKCNAASVNYMSKVNSLLSPKSY